MSGFEVAGVVLGAFPILFETATDLRTLFQDLRTWWRFETDFQNFVFGVERERIAFSQNLQLLLGPLDIDDAAKKSLVEDPNHVRWHSPQFQAELRQTLQPRDYEWFIREMNNIHMALAELQGLLRLNEVGLFLWIISRLQTRTNAPKVSIHNRKAPQAAVEKEMFRLQVSFTHRKDSLLAGIRDKNSGLYDFLVRSLLISRYSTALPANRKPIKTLGPVMTLQQCGAALYRSLQRQWCCACPLGHHFGITVEKSGETQAGPSLHFQLFILGTNHAAIKVRHEVLLSRPNTPTVRDLPSRPESVSGSGTKHTTTPSRFQKLKVKGNKTRSRISAFFGRSPQTSPSAADFLSR